MAIVNLISAVRPDYAVIDATVRMEGLWQSPQDKRELGLIIAGRDPLGRPQRLPVNSHQNLSFLRHPQTDIFILNLHGLEYNPTNGASF